MTSVNIPLWLCVVVMTITGVAVGLLVYYLAERRRVLKSYKNLARHNSELATTLMKARAKLEEDPTVRAERTAQFMELLADRLNKNDPKNVTIMLPIEQAEGIEKHLLSVSPEGPGPVAQICGLLRKAIDASRENNGKDAARQRQAVGTGDSGTPT